MTSATDTRFMRQALALGRRGLGQVWPNPAVGCVIVKEGKVVGRGRTAIGGRPHAEAVALAQAGELANGATAYVTLEPCAHHGQTPPCAQALVAAGIARVVCPLKDPDPRVAGQGFEALRQAGVTVDTGLLADAAAQDQAGFLSRVTQGRPHLTLKLATSFDGRIATASGDSQWITGPAARRAVHGARMRHDAVLVGGGTARADDPMLTVRDLGVAHQPVRIVASRHLNIPIESRLVQSAAQIPFWALHGNRTGDVSPELVQEFQSHGASCVPVGVSDAGQLDPAAMLAALGGLGLTRVFCEGGGVLAASLLQAGLVDEVMLFTAGIALGAEGLPALGALGLAQLSEAPRFSLRSVTSIGGDVCQIWARA